MHHYKDTFITKQARYHCEIDDPRLPERFWLKVSPEPNSGCWLWLGANSGTGGYGKFWFEGKDRYSHRHAYEALIGPVPEHLDLDHLCRVTSCCNPLHLEAVPHVENIRRGNTGKISGARQKAKTHCPNGHPYDEANTYHNPKTNQRHCRACHRKRVR